MNERFYLSVEEAAQQLHCCEKTIYKAIAAKRLGAYRPPGTRRWLITPEDLRAFVEGESVLR
ncbi:MAG: helix-turn-helix domain-containing protein [Chloroflexi bacterium]|nr:helix-turn-helix domain-containing protein [Chloroflexota bacterium]